MNRALLPRRRTRAILLAALPALALVGPGAGPAAATHPSCDPETDACDPPPHPIGPSVGCHETPPPEHVVAWVLACAPP